MAEDIFYGSNISVNIIQLGQNTQTNVSLMLMYLHNPISFCRPCWIICAAATVELMSELTDAHLERLDVMHNVMQCTITCILLVRRKISSSCGDSANQGGKMQNHNIPCWRWRMKKPIRTNLHWEERPADTEHWIGSWPSLCLLEPTIPSGKHRPCRGDLGERPSFLRTQQKRVGTSSRQWKMLLHLADGVGDRDRVRPWRGRAQLGQEGHGRRRHLPRHLQVQHHVLVASWGHLVHSGRVFPGQEQEEERLALFAGFDDGHITSYDGHHLTHEKSWQAHKVSWVKK